MQSELWPPLVTEGYAEGMFAVSRNLLNQLPQQAYHEAFSYLARQGEDDRSHDRALQNWLYLYREPTELASTYFWKVSASVLMHTCAQEKQNCSFVTP
jgi:hypothetical protein